jgi:hypothetical protein
MQKIYNKVLTIKNAQQNHRQHTHLNTDISGQCPWKTPEGKTNKLEVFIGFRGRN